MLKGNVITVNSIHYVKERVLFLGFAVLCEKYEGEIKNCEPHKCEGWQFYPINKLPEDTLDFHRTFLKNYIDSISYTEEVK
ncbi:MAG: hypothetical protein QOE22_482 [Candidatus Parcubacteria bacterium]|nr:hypothetical protein [Candidatus Parcubacteria bacterium]